MNIFLIGFMGSGKSTIGSSLARRLRYRFVDLDHLIETETGKSITRIFAEDGEEYFRNLEHSYLQTFTKNGNTVISTGGGTPCHHNNMDFMNANGITVYLSPTPDILVGRLANARSSRPLVANKSRTELLEYIVETLKIRDEFYTRANVTITNPSRDITNLINILSPYLESERSTNTNLL